MVGGVKGYLSSLNWAVGGTFTKKRLGTTRVVKLKSKGGKWEWQRINRVNGEGREKMKRGVRHIRESRERRAGTVWRRRKQRDRCSSAAAAALPSERQWGMELQLSMKGHFPDRDPFRKWAGNFHLLHAFWADYQYVQRRFKHCLSVNGMGKYLRGTAHKTRARTFIFIILLHRNV